MDETEVRAVREADVRFFEALVRADGTALDRLLHERFVLVDVLTGSVVPKAGLVPLIASRRLVFDAIDAVDPDGEAPEVRFFGTTAVAVGRTTMTGSFDGAPFAARSRYTHVFTTDAGVGGHDGRGGHWVLVNAQGTPLA
ncbi:nuclear transport factor 2 family protein [Streptomyces sp. NPDC097981]|uniref:nuclear transport factor 2 family protein n=1 Tax=Streptomyces sp. NPDC097981 TaxID=3155428 RepID=UPI0033305161